VANISREPADLLVVGAGPIGSAMALKLLRRGARCRVIDKSNTPSQILKALGLQLRTLEIFEGMGIGKPA